VDDRHPACLRRSHPRHARPTIAARADFHRASPSDPRGINQPAAPPLTCINGHRPDAATLPPNHGDARWTRRSSGKS
jgi:hypothetical protein